jgi:HSP20 family molecular chaperone IbpA
MAFSRSWAHFQMEEFRHSVDEMLEHLRGKIGYPLGSGSAALKPPIESFVEEGRLTVCVELPGIEPQGHHGERCGRHADDPRLA